MENGKPNNWLLAHADNTYSQLGEDGILAKIFEVIGTENKWCVEFGANDGVAVSNTCRLIREESWQAVLIEAESKHLEKIHQNYEQSSDQVVVLNEMVSFEGEGKLDNLLSKTKIPKDFDLLSIDIDGNDYHVWEAVEAYVPRVVVIEYNPTIPSNVEFVQARSLQVRQGNSLLSLINLGKLKDYELVCANRFNAFFVLKELFPAFEIADNSIEEIRTIRDRELQIFQLFDGTFMIRGCQVMLWCGQHPIDSEDMQVLPPELRGFPPSSDALDFLAEKRDKSK